MATLSANGKTIDLSNVRLYTESSGTIRLTCNDDDLDKPLALVLKEGSPQEKIAKDLFAKMKFDDAEIVVKIGRLKGRGNLPVTIGLDNWALPLMEIQGLVKSGKTTLLRSLHSQVEAQADSSYSITYIDTMIRTVPQRSSQSFLSLALDNMMKAASEHKACRHIIFIDGASGLSYTARDTLKSMMAYSQTRKNVFLRVFVTRHGAPFTGFADDRVAEAVLQLNRMGDPGEKVTTASLYFDEDPIENIVVEF